MYLQIMTRLFTILSTLLSWCCFAQEQPEIMYRIENQNEDVCGYVNAQGDTLIPFGECVVCFSDSLPYAIVLKWDDQSYGFPAINAKDEEVFRVFVFDNGPDYIEEGTFRIVKDGKIGYASVSGEIIVPPMYEAAWPFENGRAQVSLYARKEQDGEHWFWTETDWFYIDKNGNRQED